MKSLDALLARPRSVLGLVLALTVAGVLSWMNMPREEDPRLAERMGLLVAPYPGGDILDVERLVVEPLEDELAEVDVVLSVRATVRAGVAILTVELRPDVTETDLAWSDVEDAIERAHAEMPPAVPTLALDHDIFDTESVVVALRGTGDRLALRDVADEVEARLLGVEGVARVERAGDPGEQITIDLDDASARRLGIDVPTLAALLQRSDVTTPGGTLRVGGRALTLRPEGDFRDVEDIRALPIPVGREGAALPLSAIAEVRRTVAMPETERARFDGDPALTLGVVPRPSQQAERFGARVQEALDEIAEAHPETRFDVLAFQPARVETRLSELGGSLLLGVGIVALVVLLAMGLRVGLVVASVVPLVTFASLAVYAASGGVLHQMAVAALGHALGSLVDNAIVVAEAIQRRIDDGEAPAAAARQGARELALPLAAATGTTLASFVPMLLAEGTVGDFTRAIPLVVMMTLGVSYAYALLVTPTLARVVLRPSRSRSSWIDPLATRVGRFAARRPVVTLVAALGVVFGSGSFALGVHVSFFPSTDRDQLLVEVELPEGTHLEETDAAARAIEARLRGDARVENVAAFVGRNAPRFYYNLPQRPNAPHLAQIVVNTREQEHVDELRREVEAHAREAIPDATVIARRLEQGPPVLAPIEVRLLGEDLEALAEASDAVRRQLRELEGTRHVRSDQGLGAPTLRWDLDDGALARHGVTREGAALALLGHARGLPVGRFRGGEDPANILLRSELHPRAPRGEDTALADLVASDLARPGATPLPLAEVARPALDWQPAVVQRRDRSRLVSVLSEHEDEVTYESVIAELRPKLEAMEWPAGVEWEIGGAAAESAKANASLGSKGPLAALLLVVILLAEFNSFRRVGIVLMTAPLAMLGIWPGLNLLHLPFGFMSLLGAIALIGIAVNGAIVLLDVVERRRAAGASVEDALIEAVRLRTRPILLTTATTVAGLLPLLLSDSTLWPPMAAAMISGLVVATLLTLAVVPALYRLLFRERRGKAPLRSAAVVAAAMAMVVAPASAQVGAGDRTESEAPSSTRETTAQGFDLGATLHGEGTPMTAEDAARRMVAQAPELAAAAASVAEAEAELRRTRVDLFPRWNLSARYTRIGPVDNDPLVPPADPGQAELARTLLAGVDDPEARLLLGGLLEELEGFSQGGIEVPRNQYALRAEVLFPVTAVLSQVLPATRAREANRDVSEERRAATRAELELRARVTFHRYVRARSVLAVAQHRRVRAIDQRRRVRALVDAGSAPEVDADTADALVAGAEIEVLRAEAGAEAAAEALRTLLGLPEGPIAVVAELGASLPEVPSLGQLHAGAIGARPETSALRAAVRAQRALSRSANAARYPSVSIAAAVDYANPNQRFVPQRTRFDASWDVSAVLQWSPDGAVRAGAQAARAEAAELRVEAELEALARRIRVELAEARSTYVAARAARRLASEAVASAETAHRARARRYEVGSGSLGEVIDADAERTVAAVRRIDAEIEARIAWARLVRLSGGVVRPLE